MPPHERHWLMRIDYELNADVDPATLWLTVN